MSTAVASGAGLLKDVLPADRILTGDAASEWAVAGRSPAAVAFPRSADDVASLLALAREERWAVEPAGLGGGLRAGNPVRRMDLVLSTREMTRVVEHAPGDLTLTAHAGLPLGELQRTAGEERQWLAADPPGEEGSLGALVATGVAGPLHAGFGGPRDLVLGVEVVTGEGKRLRLGGRVLKNVAGFDLARLMVGSRGTLGVVTAATVRLHPLPAADRTWVLDAPQAENLLPAARRVATAGVQPAALELVEYRGGLRGAHRALLAFRIVGPPERVEAEAALLEDAAGRPLSPFGPGEARTLWRDVRRMEEDAALALRMALPPASAPDLVAVARSVGRVKGGRDELARSPLRSALHVATGILRVAVPNLRTDSGWDVRWAERLGDLRRTLEARGGSLVIAHGPPAIVGRVGAWGDPGPAARLMREIRSRLDPGGILSPGRFVVPDGPEAPASGGDVDPSTDEDI